MATATNPGFPGAGGIGGNPPPPPPGPPGAMPPPGAGGTPGGLPPPGGGTGGGGPVPDSYFTESRKGEVNELRNLLRGFSAERDPMRKRDIIKKVIAYMTLGIDVSRLFTEMMLAIETRDLVIKKMVYLYLCNYAATHPELAQMCTNTLQKDCGNEDPMVRGLALRALCSLRLPQMVEYISEPLRKSLTDGHAYVRKTGVMGILKLHDLDREAFERCNFVDILYDMLRDPDASVVANCILVLNEIMAKSPNGGMAINRAVMLHLLNRMHEFSEFGVVAVLDLIPRYIPANDEEGYQIMNLLDPVLRTTNSGAVLAVIKAFLSLAEQIGDDANEMKRQVVGRVKAPLITHLSSGSAELVYCLLKHVESLVEICPGIFDDEYRQFYVRYHEPTHIKYLKVQVLSKLVNPSNAPDVVAELSECVNDTDESLSRLAVRSLSLVACRGAGGEGCAESIARRFVEMLDLDVGHVSSEAASALADVVRKHPNLKPVVAPPLPRAVRYIAEPAGKASALFLLGECGDVVNEAPYVLERLVDSYDDIRDDRVKTALLTNAVKLFFKRPPEVQKFLGRLLSKATEDVSSQDLHDRALLYYRLLKSAPDPRIAGSVVSTETTVESTSTFAEEQDGELRAALMEEFNTLSVVYGKTSENFVAEEHQVTYVKMPPEHPLAPGAPPAAVPPPAATEGSVAAADGTGAAAAALGAAAAAAAPPAPPAPSAEVDLLGFHDGTSPAAASAAPSSSSSSSLLTLDPSASLTGDDYQTKWAAVPDADAIVTIVDLSRLPGSTSDVESALSKSAVLTMASGDLEDQYKFFLYAKEQHKDGMLFLVQVSVNKKPGDVSATLTLKTAGGGGGPGDDPREKVDELVEVFKSALAEFV